MDLNINTCRPGYYCGLSCGYPAYRDPLGPSEKDDQ